MAVSLSLGVVSGASAADLPAKSRPYVEAQVFSWSGFYLGLHAGYGWGSNNWNLVGVLESPTIIGNPLKPKTDGVLGGVQAGANYQLASWVFGIEADLAVMHGKGSSDGTLLQAGGAPIGITSTATSQIEWLALFTGRAGYAFDRTLFYAKGGVAAAETKDSFNLLQMAPTPQFIDFGSKNNTQVGWTIGGGIEHAFAPNWSAKIEYNYIDLGTSSENFNVLIAGAPSTTLTFRQDIEHTLQIVKVGANYRF
ncbi:outer membrane protein [Bradyrhizobium sp. URHD0069]|uniref:outer membrane protein n=1 Tax=Bradyrhizobium sp. URHD0069 TaxID=1380355 RepID=UPI0018CC2BBD|nr:outer membrane beta-barrel protein [Bradyrhizobium sp. URHD0069]